MKIIIIRHGDPDYVHDSLTPRGDKEARLLAEIIGTYNCGLKEFEIAAQLLNTGAVDVKPMCEPETFPLDRIQDAFAAAATPGMFRVHVDIPE